MSGEEQKVTTKDLLELYIDVAVETRTSIAQINAKLDEQLDKKAEKKALFAWLKTNPAVQLLIMGLVIVLLNLFGYQRIVAQHVPPAPQIEVLP